MGKSSKKDLSRKSFLKKMGTASAALAGVPFLGGSSSQNIQLLREKQFLSQSDSSADTINVALIGAGLMGQGDLNTSLQHSGVEMVAACDLYDSRLVRCMELYGEHIYTTTDYRKILERPDVDAVIIATSDHWHERITVDALRAGKAVYLEKPMVQHINEARRLIEAEEESGLPLLVGSQRTSSIIYEKARDLLQSGEIGKLNFVEGYWDRLSAIGAWQYSIPPNASEHNVDWEAYRRGMDRIPFDATHFFRWRNYDDYGTGVAGDLFVHLFSGLHLITGSLGPDSVMATGGLRHWYDGRDAEDVMLGLFNYPETDDHPNFTLSLRVNFADGSGGGSQIRLVGNEGEIEIGWNHVTLRKSTVTDKPGYTISDFSEATREDFLEHYEERYPEQRARIIEPREFVYRAPDGYSDRYDHFGYFFDAIRNGTPLTQNSTFGLRACGPALLANVSHREKKIVNWNPESMEVV
jgi:predicted dehydrogenase